MAYKNTRRVAFGALMGAPFAALQWRLLLLWVLLMLLPAMVVALPLMHALGALLDHSVHADAWARQFDAMMFGDTVRELSDSHGALGGTFFAALAITLLLAPLLNGMIVGSGRAGRSLGFGQLLQSGVVEYGRMFRLMLWSLLPYAAAVMLVKTGMNMLDDKTEAVTLESQAVSATYLVAWLSGLWVVLAQVIVESGRAAFIADTGLRSATVAIWRGIMQLLRRPFSSLFGYLFITAIGFGIAFALGVARAHTTPAGGLSVLLAFLLSQLVVVAIGWMRIARLFALAEVARSLVGGGRRVGY
ncbi:hypothetical protein [Dyella subtropica]|uniref:hypothetical protein n=1 Tax=Dyella subtropica TaxID=2992127 RepID=UPI00225192D7|nr:hypothetical protein [Dyella subtropica]